MNGDWHDLLSALGPLTGPVVAVGAGRGGLAAALVAAGAQHGVMFEGDPRLQARLAGLPPGLRLVAGVAGTAPGTGRLRLVNLAEASGLRRATGLADLFPGLAETGTAEVEVHDLAALWPEGERILLALDAAGDEGEILAHLARRGCLAGCAALLVRTGRVPGHDGAPPLAELVAQLSVAGWQVADLAAEDPARPVLCFRRSALAAPLAEQTARATRAEATLTETQKKLDETTAARTAATDRAAKAEATLTETQKKLDETTAARNTATDRATKAEATLTETQKKLDETTAARNTATDRAAKAEATLSETQKKLDETTAARNTATDRATKAEARLAAREAELQAEIRAARDEQALAQRLHLMAANDLRDLRSRHADLHDRHEAQVRLVAELVPRLREAAQRMREVEAGDAPELPAPAEADTRAIAPAARRRKKHKGD
jgi:predicted nuclease with TOPRIM domain